ncbi:MAG TPA: hypothetical protein PKZ52_16975, partial [Cellvibrionaceae bacterium]|nr:hypothetical protein [Cellvibrionaceae bacterium]
MALRLSTFFVVAFYSATLFAQDPPAKTAPAAATTKPAPAAQLTLPLEDLRLFAKAFENIRTGYVSEISDAKLLEYALKGMLSELDPHSAYLDSSSLEDLQTHTTGEFGGLGIEVGGDENGVKVISPMDDRFLGDTPFSGPIPLGNHRLRVERRLFLTQLRPLELAPGVAPLHFRVSLERSGLIDMALGGMIAGAGLGLMVLRLFLGEEIETLPRQEFYKPLAAAALPAALGASEAGLAGWQMPAREAQLLIGSAGWGTIVGFGLGLGAQPQGPLPHVLAVGFGVVGGTLGAAAYRFVQPSSGAIAMFNTTVLWSAVAGALGWAYVISERPETAFYGHPSTGR